MATMLEPRTDDRQLRRAQRELLARLRVVRRRLRRHLLIEGLFWTLTALMIAVGASLAIDLALRLSLPARLGLAAVAVVAIVAVVALRLAVPLLLPLADLDLAELLDRRVRGVGQRISNVLQLPELLSGDDHASPSMVHAAVIDCAAALERVDLTAPLNKSRLNRLLAGCGVWLFVAAGFVALLPDTASLWARRWLAGSNVRWPQHTYLNIVGLGDDATLLVPRGELALVQIDANPRFEPGETASTWTLTGRGETLVVETPAQPASRPPPQVSLSYTLADGSTRRGNGVQFDASSFRHELPPLAEPVELDVVGGDDWFGPITVEPVDRPAVASLQVTAQRPGSESSETQNVGDAKAQFLYLPQTRLDLRLVADQPLASAEVLDQGEPVAGWRRVDDRTYTLSWTMQESLALEFRLIGRRGSLSSKPYFLSIGLLKDREPRLTVRASGVGRRIAPVARIPLALHATDDFGIASLTLDLERTDVVNDKPQAQTATLDLAAELSPTPDETQQEAARTDVELDYELALRERGLSPGNVLKLRAVSTDNCALGSQTGNSRTLVFQIVSSDELFYEILMRQREQRAKFNVATESAKVQTTALANLAQPQDALAVVRAEQVIARTVWQVANQLEASLLEMTLNDLGNPQARDMLQDTIITPLRSLHEDLLARLRAAVDVLARQESVSDANRGEAHDLSEESVKVMETILAQMAQWESFIDVVNQLKQIIQRQDEVLKTTEEIQKKRTNSLFDD